MMEDLTLEEAVERLSHQEAFDIVIAELMSMCDAAIDSLEDSPAEKLQVVVGKIGAYREILGILGVQ